MTELQPVRWLSPKLKAALALARRHLRNQFLAKSDPVASNPEPLLLEGLAAWIKVLDCLHYSKLDFVRARIKMPLSSSGSVQVDRFTDLLEAVELSSSSPEPAQLEILCNDVPIFRCDPVWPGVPVPLALDSTRDLPSGLPVLASPFGDLSVRLTRRTGSTDSIILHSVVLDWSYRDQIMNGASRQGCPGTLN